MDFDRNAQGEARLGSDGCLDFAHQANAGLPDIWCDTGDCPLTNLYNDVYASFMSKADFWVASADAVMRVTSPNQDLVLPFRWGRKDRDVCPDSSARLPEPHGCSEVERTFITRMGLTWTDAVALMGAHTLGKGHEEFSGHEGTWVRDAEQATIFNRQYYRETTRRAWRPRSADAGTNWIWGNPTNRNVLMLNTDICLRFDIPDGNEQRCCTRNDNRCTDPVCESSAVVRPEAFEAFERFDVDVNGPFFDAFAIAWEKATEAGIDPNTLHELTDTCDSEPTPSPSEECVDRDCSWVVENNLCGVLSILKCVAPRVEAVLWILYHKWNIFLFLTNFTYVQCIFHENKTRIRHIVSRYCRFTFQLFYFLYKN